MRDIKLCERRYAGREYASDDAHEQHFHGALRFLWWVQGWGAGRRGPAVGGFLRLERVCLKPTAEELSTATPLQPPPPKSCRTHAPHPLASPLPPAAAAEGRGNWKHTARTRTQRGGKNAPTRPTTPRHNNIALWLWRKHAGARPGSAGQGRPHTQTKRDTSKRTRSRGG